MALEPLTLLLPFQEWLVDRERRGKLVARIDGSKIEVIQISDVEFLAAQKVPPRPLPGDGYGGHARKGRRGE